jgi:hypothetical protein
MLREIPERKQHIALVVVEHERAEHHHAGRHRESDRASNENRERQTVLERFHEFRGPWRAVQLCPTENELSSDFTRGS